MKGVVVFLVASSEYILLKRLHGGTLGGLGTGVGTDNKIKHYQGVETEPHAIRLTSKEVKRVAD